MSKVYIEGFKMPKSCGECPLNRASSCSCLPIISNGKLAGWTKFPFGILEEYKNLYKDCPLREEND